DPCFGLDPCFGHDRRGGRLVLFWLICRSDLFFPGIDVLEAGTSIRRVDAHAFGRRPVVVVVSVIVVVFVLHGCSSETVVNARVGFGAVLDLGVGFAVERNGLRDLVVLVLILGLEGFLGNLFGQADQVDIGRLLLGLVILGQRG